MPARRGAGARRRRPQRTAVSRLRSEDAQARVGTFDTELVHDFLLALANQLGMNLHVDMLARAQPAPHHRGGVQGVRARHGRRHAASTARRRGAVDERDALRVGVIAREALRHAKPSRSSTTGWATCAACRRASSASASSAGHHARPDVDRARAAASCCPASAPSAPAWTISARYGLVEPVRRVRRAAARRSSASASACSCSSTRARSSGRCAASASCRGRCVRFRDRDPTGSARFRTWAGTRSASARRAPHLAGVDDGASVYFVHSYYVGTGRPGVDRDRRPTTAASSSPRSRATTSSPASSTPRRASASACASSPTSRRSPARTTRRS